MITLIDRADGTELCTLSPEDFIVLQDNLVRESEQDFDYYLNDGTLELLATAGMSAPTVSALSHRMRHRGLDVGWIQSEGVGAHSCSGLVVDGDGRPQGGIRVDLVHGDSILNWTYSRPDGSFLVASGTSDELYLRFSGRGDLVLEEVKVEAPGEQGQFELQTLRGTVMTESDQPLAGVNVLLTDWRSPGGREHASWSALGGRRSWCDTDDSGQFSIPVRFGEVEGELEVELELTTVSGETLELVILTVTPSDSMELGVVRAPDPVEPTVEGLPAELETPSV